MSLLGTLGGAASNLFLPGSGAVATPLLNSLSDYFTGPTVPASGSSTPSQGSGSPTMPVIKAEKTHASKLGKIPH